VSVLSGAGARAVPRLLAALEHEDPRLRSGAAAALGDLSLTAETNTVATATLAEGAFARLKGLLRDPSPEVRRAAAEALGYVAGWTFQGSARLLPLLDDGDARVRAGAAVAIGASGESPDGFGARLVTVLEDLSGEDRVLGLEALLFIAEGEVEVVSPVIVRMLESEDDRTRRAAIRAAARLGGAASDASLRLRKLFREDPRVREDVLRALIELHGGASGLEPEIESALRSREAGLRSIAIEAIQGAQVPSLVPDLIEALSRLEVGEAREAIEAVARISGLRTEGLIDRFAETLGTIAGKNPAVLLGLKNLLSDRDLRLGAIKALAHAGKAGRAAIPDLKRIAWERAPEIQDAIAGTVLALEGAPEG
jgi:HEAT repeat protein